MVSRKLAVSGMQRGGARLIRRPSLAMVRLCCLTACLSLSSLPGHAQSTKIDDLDVFIPIELRCPAENNGELELLSQNKLNQREKISILYQGNKRVRLILSLSNKDLLFQEIMNIKVDEILSEGEQAFLEAVTARIQAQTSNVCFRLESDRRRIERTLAANRRSLAAKPRN